MAKAIYFWSVFLSGNNSIPDYVGYLLGNHIDWGNVNMTELKDVSKKIIQLCDESIQQIQEIRARLNDYENKMREIGKMLGVDYDEVAKAEMLAEDTAREKHHEDLINEQISYTVEDGRLDPEEAEVMTDAEKEKWVEKQKDYDPY